jgi:hypothetical protein
MGSHLEETLLVVFGDMADTLIVAVLGLTSEISRLRIFPSCVKSSPSGLFFHAAVLRLALALA